MNARSFLALSVAFVAVGQAVCQMPAVELQPRITGYLQKVHCKEGDAVKKGDLLFEIYATVYQARLELADAKVELASARLKLAIANHDRAEILRESKSLTNAEYEESKLRVTEAQAQLAVAKADRIPAAVSVAATKIHSPVDGTVTRLPDRRGQSRQSG